MLPIHRNDPSQLTEAYPAIPHGAAPAPSKCILLVDDNEALRRLASTVLENAGYQVYEAENATSAVAVAANLEHLDLLISDVELPGMNGLELGSEIGCHHPAAITLYVSGYAIEDVFEGDAVTAHPFLQKPFAPSTLLTTVSALLTRSAECELKAGFGH